MKPNGAGIFDPIAPRFAFDFEIASTAGWTAGTPAGLRVDNFSFAKPAYYVKPAASGGSDSNNGRSEATAFATPAKAVSVAQAGDIIDIMEGAYIVTGSGDGAIAFKAAGTPAAWITLKNYPGQSPLINNEWWNAILIGRGSAKAKSIAPALGYIEVRGMHIHGNADVAAARYPASMNKVDPLTNNNGISADGRFETNHPHDIRFADNVIEYCSGGGINALDSDRIQVENNTVQNTSWWTIYASSGISIFSAYDFDGTAGTYTRLVRNNITSGNQTFNKWLAKGIYSDGNGIIIDVNHNTDYLPNDSASGRTLVTNNVSFANGGSGIHSYSAEHVDIVNNVAYLNSASPQLQYPEIFANSATDVRVYNNIMVAPVADTARGEMAEPVNNGTASQFRNNVYFGGNIAPVLGTGDVIVDPKFVLPSTDPATADFRLQSTSPAINRGTTPLAPPLDIAADQRYGNPDSGAYEFIPPAPTAVALAGTSDTGVVGDNYTNLNNTSAVRRLSFVVTGTLSGAAVGLYAGGRLIGSASAIGASTTVLTDGVKVLADGALGVMAVQTFAGAPSSSSPALGITIDTVSPVLAAAVSRKTHGSRGVFDLALNLASAAGVVEPRKGGPNTLVFTFDQPVAAIDGTLSGNDFSITGGAFANASIAGNTLTMSLVNVTDRTRVSVALNGIGDLVGNAISGDRDVTIRALLGDVDGSGRVDIFDQQAVKNNLFKPLTSLVYLFDLDASGSVNIFDQQIVKDDLLHVLS